MSAAWIILILQAIGLVIGFGERKMLTGSLFILLFWPLWVPVIVLGVVGTRLGLFVTWHGPMSDTQLQRFRNGIYWERRVGPFASGFWYRNGDVAANRWLRVGRVGGKGFTLGRAHRR